MAVLYSNGYVIGPGDFPLTHTRIAHGRNWLTGGTVVASSTAEGFSADAALNSLTYSRWQPVSLPATWEYDHGSASTADYIGISAHRLGTQGAVFTLQYHDGGGWVDLVGPATVSDDQPILALFPPTSASRWRISIASATSAPYIGVFKVGRALQMPQPFYGGHAPLDFARQTTMRSNISTTGEWLGRTVVRRMFGTSFNWEHITADWVREYWKDAQRAMETEPFFIAWRPAAFGEVGYCMIDENVPPSNMGVVNYMTVQLNVRGYGYE